MTLKQLERYLEMEKWREGALRGGADMCGRYARCSYCDRFEEYPCATAYHKYTSANVPSRQEKEYVPEPPVAEVFGTDRADDMKREAPAPVVLSAKSAREDSKRRGVICVRQGKGETRVLSLKKKNNGSEK